MRKAFLTAATLLMIAFSGRADVTLEQCLDAARDNYPLIKKYELLSAMENVELSDINKGWLPKIGVYTQGTIQNVVPSFPPALYGIIQKMGGEISGLGKFQHKIGLDLNQTVWDGGLSKSQRVQTRRQTVLNNASLNVEIYGIRQRVESIYFGILLLQSQIEQTESAKGVYEANIARLHSMLSNGTAMQSDVDMVEAQLLSIGQQLISAKTAVKAYRNILSIFTGLDLSDEALVTPNAEIPADMSNNRPELALFDARKTLNDCHRNSIEASLMPKIGFFAQTYYGYPGFDYFNAMMNRDLSFNIMAGIRVSWNLDSFYTKKNAFKKIEITNQQIETQQETFNFNNSMQAGLQLDEIHGIEAVMREDGHIVDLRRNVRLAAESQLRNGIIDAASLTAKINDETLAQLNAAYHKIQRLQAIYNLKNTLNR